MHDSDLSENRFFSIRNWKKFQHYSQRNPPWIRLYASLLRERNYQKLSDTARSHLIGLFILASQHQNSLPDDQDWLRHELCTKSPIDLETLNEFDWIEFTVVEKPNSLKKNTNTEEQNITLHSIAKRDACTPLAARKQDASKPKEQAALLKHICGSFQNVQLSDNEEGELCKRFGDTGAHQRIDALSEYKASKGKKYRNDYATILSWERKNGHGQHKTKADHTAEAAERVLTKLDQEGEFSF